MPIVDADANLGPCPFRRPAPVGRAAYRWGDRSTSMASAISWQEGATQWVRNLRVAGGGELRVHGATTRFRAVEIDGPERDRIVAAYRAKQGRTVEALFRQLPSPQDHPVFRVDPRA